MKKIICVVLCLISFPLFSQETPLVFERFAYSGYVIPSARFSYRCELNIDQKLTITKSKADENGQMHTTQSEETISMEEFSTIIHLLIKANFVEEIEGPMPCDIGTNAFVGHLADKKFDLDSYYDCVGSRIRKSPAVDELVIISQKLCGF